MPEPRASTLAGRKRHWIPSRTNLCGIMLYTEHKIYLSQNSPGWPVWADRRCISTSDYWRVTEQRKEKIHDLRVEHFYSSPKNIASSYWQSKHSALRANAKHSKQMKQTFTVWSNRKQMNRNCQWECNWNCKRYRYWKCSALYMGWGTFWGEDKVNRFFNCQKFCHVYVLQQYPMLLILSPILLMTIPMIGETKMFGKNICLLNQVCKIV